MKATEKNLNALREKMAAKTLQCTQINNEYKGLKLKYDFLEQERDSSLLKIETLNMEIQSQKYILANWQNKYESLSEDLVKAQQVNES